MQDEAGQWHEIDTTLVRTDGGWAPAWADSDLVISDGGAATFVELSERGRDLAWKWSSPLPEPVVDGATATYAGVAPGDGDLVVTATASGFSYDVVLHEQPSAPVQLATPVTTDGGNLVETPSGGLEVTTPAGAVVAQAPQPLMWDNQTDTTGEPVNVTDVDASVTTTASGGRLVLTPDEEFLADPDTEYPVTVDPSFTTYTTGDLWVQNTTYTNAQTGSEELRAGSDDGGDRVARSFLNFKGVTWSDYHVLDAQLKLWNYYSASCSSGAIRAAMINEDWTAGALTWSHQPTASTSTTYYDDYSPAHGASSCDPDDAVFDVTGMVQAWADGTKTNRGIRLKAVNENTSNTWRKYRSVNYTTHPAWRPKLIVTYNRAPKTSGSVVVAPGNPGYSRSLTPSVQIQATDPDSDPVSITYEVYNSAGTQIWKTTTDTPVVFARPIVLAKPGLMIPSGKLSNGQTYTVKARAIDSHGLEADAYSPVTTFTVDTGAPVATVSASEFTDGVWDSDMPSSNTLSLDGPGDTASFTVSLDGATQTVQASGSGHASLSWLPAAGAHTVEVAATDHAGNQGPVTTFSFGVGGGSNAGTLTAPTAALRTTGTVPAHAESRSGATSATLKWRYTRPAGSSGGWNTASEVTTATGSAWSGSVSTSGAFSVTPDLVWDATSETDPDSDPEDPAEVSAPALLQVKVCFTYPGGTLDTCTPARQVQLVPSAFGGSFPVTTVGPATVALFTGEASIGEVDAVDTLAGMGRTFSSFDASTLASAPGAFGPGWSTTVLAAAGETTAELVDHRELDGTLVLVTAGGSSQTFTPTDPGTDPTTSTDPVEFSPVGIDDGSRMLWSPAASGQPATVELTRSATTGDGTVTTWVASTETDGGWVLSDTSLGEATDGDPVTSYGHSASGHADDSGYPTWIAQTAPGNAATCTASVQEPGCRGLRMTYSGTGSATRLTGIEQVTGASGGTGTSRTLATYSYGTTGANAGLLTQVCGPDPDTSSSSIGPLCASYGYTTVGDRTLLSSATPPGQAAWHFGYDDAGRLVTVSRALDSVTNTGTGNATWAIGYDLSAGASGLPDLSAVTAAQWGQTEVPDRAFAVFGPAHVPSMSGGTPAPTASDLGYAQVWFTDSEGAVTNAAVHANTTADASGDGHWLVDTTWYDEHGNVVRTLDGAGRDRVLAVDTAERAETALAASSLTVYSSDGRRVEAEYEPAHTATLQGGTTGLYRAGTTYTYEDEAPALGGGSKPAYDEDAGQTSFDLVVESTHAAFLPDLSSSTDTSTVRYEYGPVVAGDGNGWDLGAPTKTLTGLGGGAWSTEVTRYDTLGRTVETRQPGGAANGAGEGTDAHATVMSYYTAANADDDCRINGHAARKGWDGLTCKSGPAGQPAGSPMPVSYTSDYNQDLQPSQVVESSGATTRTTTTSYDALGRVVSSSVAIPSGSAGAAADTRSSTVGYDPDSGLAVSTSGGGQSVTTAYDSWGRVRSYTDATGLTSSTTYTADGLIASLNDGVGTTTYSYDQSGGERRRVPTTVDVGLASGPDQFTMSWTGSGAPNRVVYPDGLLADRSYDETGAAVGLVYASGGVDLLGFTNTLDVDARTVAATSPASAQRYSYDPSWVTCTGSRG